MQIKDTLEAQKRNHQSLHWSMAGKCIAVTWLQGAKQSRCTPRDAVAFLEDIADDVTDTARILSLVSQRNSGSSGEDKLVLLHLGRTSGYRRGCCISSVVPNILSAPKSVDTEM